MQPHPPRPISANEKWAMRLLAHEGAAGTSDECATAAGRVHDKLHSRLAPLVGAAGVQALIARSVRVVEGKFPWLAGLEVGEGSTSLCERLAAQGPAVAAEASAALFGNFLALITMFIGQRLTTQALRGAWPTIEEMAGSQTTND